jgi:hypothetical protein
LVIGVMSCWSGGQQPTATEATQPKLETSGHDPRGAYWCTIDDESFAQHRFACVIKTVGSRLVLGKLTGSERIRGIVTPREDGFELTGELYCRWTACTRSLVRGTFRDDPIVIRLMPAPTNAFGGDGYGGDGYGDPFGYGGPAGGKR